MGTFKKIDGRELDAVLDAVTRQYLVGHLSRPQAVRHIDDERLEIGISHYADADSEEAHRHTEATEFQYMLTGWTQYLDVDTGEVHDFRAGDFYAIDAPTGYAQRSKAGTRILFIKVPSINDKHLVDETTEVEEWRNGRMPNRRIDHWHSPDAPRANSVRPAVAVAVFNSDGELLLLRRRDSGNWTMPGGTIEHDEDMVSCAVREVREESGLDVEVTDIIGTYTDPGVLVEYSDGEVRREFTVLFAAEPVVGHVATDDESTAYGWVSLDDLEDYELAASQRRRIDDVVSYRADGRRRLR